jgi:arsenite methyltransferase
MGGWSAGPTSTANREKWATFDPLPHEDSRGQDHYQALRDQILEQAHLRAGERVLDVGAGRGLLALEARRLVGIGGLVVALDLSLGALRVCRERAASGEPAAPVRAVLGDATRLPFATGAFDVIVLRSVLMYLSNRELAIQDLHRALRPGGRVSAFEPIWRHHVGPNDYESWADVVDMTPFQPDHARIMAYLQAHPPDDNPDRVVARTFDERDLVRSFVAAGFREVALDYRYRYTADVFSDPLVRIKQVQDVPGYAAAARAVLGETAAAAYLACLTATRSAAPFPSATTQAFLVARR